LTIISTTMSDTDAAIEKLLKDISWVEHKIRAKIESDTTSDENNTLMIQFYDSKLKELRRLRYRRSRENEEKIWTLGQAERANSRLQEDSEGELRRDASIEKLAKDIAWIEARIITKIENETQSKNGKEKLMAQFYDIMRGQLDCLYDRRRRENAEKARKAERVKRHTELELERGTKKLRGLNIKN